MAKRPLVVYWNNIPSPYHVSRLNAVARQCGIELEAWFLRRTEPDRSWTVNESEWEFPHRYVSGLRLSLPRLGQHDLANPISLLARRPPQLLVSLYAEPAFLAGWAVARRLGVRTAFRVLPTFDSWVSRSKTKELVKRFVFPRVDGFKVPGPDGAAVLDQYGVEPGRIHQVTQSIDVRMFERGRSRWLPHRDVIRDKLGVKGCVFLYVGRLWRGKGLDYLFEAYAQLQERNERVSMLVVGDGRDERLYRSMCEKLRLRHVVFTGFVEGSDLCRMYAASDVFVFPTLGDPNGLVIEEAMASALPVVSSDAAGDVRLRIPEGVAGYVVPAADSTTLGVRMLQLARDPDNRLQLGASAQRIAAAKSHERYAKDFEKFVWAVLGSPPLFGRT